MGAGRLQRIESVSIVPSTSRYVIGALTLTGLAVVLSSPPVRSQSQPFTPEVDEFVRTYLKGGGDKLTNWVQGDKTSPPDATQRAFKPIAGSASISWHPSR